MDPDLFRRSAEIAAEYLKSLPERSVRASASLDQLRAALRVGLDDRSQPALQVIEELVSAADPGLIGTQSPRYFGFVIGTKWEGEPAMRISVCNWRTTEDDIRRSARAILAQVGNWMPCR